MSTELRKQAERQMTDLKEIIRRYVASCPEGATNAEVANALGISSEGLSGHKNYVTHSLLAALVREGSLRLEKRGRNTVFSTS